MKITEKFGLNMKHEIAIVSVFAVSLIFAAVVLNAAAAGGQTADAGDANQVALDEISQSQKTVDVNDISTDDETAGDVIQSISFKKDTAVRDALRFLGARYRKNIVPSPNVQGTLSVLNLYNVTFEEAIAAILGSQYKYEIDGEFIRVYTTEEYNNMQTSESRMKYRVFQLYYISAAEAKSLITPLLSEKGEVQTTAAAETGVPVDESISSAEGAGDSTAQHDTLIVHDYPERLEDVNEVITKIDQRPKQVLIEATILSAALTDSMQLGIDWQTLGATTSLTDFITSEKVDSFKSSNIGSGFTAGGLYVGVARDNIAMFIQAVESVTDVTILANPKVLALNKQLGQVYIGKKIGYKSQTTQTDSSTTQEVEFLDTGTKLSFRPYIANDGYIRIDVHAKDSSGEFNSQDVPDETSAEMVSNIMVKDGQTIVIGGLFRDKVTANKTQVPGAGDLPIIGSLFKSNTDKSEKQEVIVLLTPHIINEPAQAKGAERKRDVERYYYGARENLSWLHRDHIFDDIYSGAVRKYRAGKPDKALADLDYLLLVKPHSLEAARLRERILKETKPGAYDKLEMIMIDKINREQEPKWDRY